MRWPAGALLALLLAGCEADDGAMPEEELAPVVVYAAYADKTYLPALLNEYTVQTGVTVIVRNGTVPGIVNDVITGRVSPLADVLLTPSVYDVWRTAEEGELRPNYSSAIADAVPGWLRDPDSFWIAFSYRHAVLAYDPEAIAVDDLDAYAALASPAVRGKLCLSASALPINRAVVATLMQTLGDREAELAVRGWIANLAEPVFDSEEKLLQAIASGSCAVGIVSSDVAAKSLHASLRIFEPPDVVTQLEGLAVTRHARNPDGAFALVDWMLSDSVQARHAKHTGAYPVTQSAGANAPVVTVAVRHEEAGKLAERARYR